MIKKRPILVFAIGVAVLLGSYGYHQSSSKQVEGVDLTANNHSLETKLNELQKTLTKIQQQRDIDQATIASLEQQLLEQQEISTNKQATIVEEQQENVQVHSEEQPSDGLTTAQRREQMLNEMEDHFIMESQDPEWASATESRFTEGFAEFAAQGNQLSEFECRSTLCKVEVYSDGSGAQAVREVLTDDAFGEIQGFWAKETDPLGQEKMTMYFTRDGHRLPGERES